ncbi:permease-like cell division protein FtsX [Acidaminobacterium chupaoyuni]
MKQWNIKYYLKEGIHNFFSHRFMTVAAITVIAACLLITASFSLIAYNLDLKIADLETQSEIVVFVDETYTREQAQAIGAQITAIENVSKAEFITKEQALENYKAKMGEDAFILEGLENDNPLRDSYRITMKNISLHQETVNALSQIPGIAETSSKKEFSDKLIRIRSVVNAISYTLVAMLGAVSIFIISNTVKLAMFARREEIAIMRMVGATNHFIRTPFVVEGLCLGEVAALLAFFMEWGVYNYIAKDLVEASGIMSLVEFGTFSTPLLLVMLVAGMIVGVGGSVMTIRKFLKV